MSLEITNGKYMFLITNNPKVQYDESIPAEKIYVAGSYEEVLTKVRDMVHKGYRLLSHPLSGSIKPNETPYKSVLVSGQPGELDLDSLNIIEHSMETYRKFAVISVDNQQKIPKDILSDFSEIDHSLIVSALKNVVSGGQPF